MQPNKLFEFTQIGFAKGVIVGTLVARTFHKNVSSTSGAAI